MIDLEFSELRLDSFVLAVHVDSGLALAGVELDFLVLFDFVLFVSAFNLLEFLLQELLFLQLSFRQTLRLFSLLSGSKCLHFFLVFLCAKEQLFLLFLSERQ